MYGANVLSLVASSAPGIRGRGKLVCGEIAVRAGDVLAEEEAAETSLNSSLLITASESLLHSLFLMRPRVLRGSKNDFFAEGVRRTEGDCLIRTDDRALFAV